MYYQWVYESRRKSNSLRKISPIQWAAPELNITTTYAGCNSADVERQLDVSTLLESNRQT
jgi:hypothetical protein